MRWKTLPSTTRRSHAVISPESEISRPTISLRVSVSARRICGTLPAVEPVSTTIRVRPQELEAHDMHAERTGAVMVLAVDIIGDRAAHRHVLGAGQDRKKPAVRDDDGEDLRQGDPGFTAEHAGSGVEGNEAVERGHIEQHTPRVEAAVAIAAPAGERKHGGGKPRDGERL